MTKTLSLARDHENQREVVRTPRSNRQLPQLLAPFATLAEGLDYAAQGVTGFNFYSARGALQDVLPYALLRRRALSTARKLLSLGFERGDRVAVVAETGPDFIVVFFACQYAGLVPCPMPYTMYIGGKDAYVERVAGMLRAARAGTVITPEDLLGHISEGAARAGAKRVLTFGDLQSLPEAATKLEPFRAGRAGLYPVFLGFDLQPQGRADLAERPSSPIPAAFCATACSITQDDRAFSWLPLYHDMGLVGFCLAPMMGQVHRRLSRHDVLRPPPGAVAEADVGQSVDHHLFAELRLRSRGAAHQWRCALRSTCRACAWPASAATWCAPTCCELFADTLGVAGFRSAAFLPSYGMAETTLAISFVDADAPIRIDSIDRHALKTEARAVPAKGEACAQLRGLRHAPAGQRRRDPRRARARRLANARSGASS